MQEKYSYASQPHAAPVKRRPKYRNENDPGPPEPYDGNVSLNMMHDPRVVRGNTYAAKVMTSSVKQEQLHLQKENSRRVKQEATKRRNTNTVRVGTPPPVEGRVHMTIQTENFLEDLTDKPAEVDAETQTQAFMDRPVSPLFVATKTGIDEQTQIEPGDLFDFDLEVEPILEVLVGKTIHVSMLELMQEEELENIRREQEQFEAVRNIELAEVQRLEAEARRKAQEKDRRIAQEKQRVQDRIELEEKIAARAFSSQYLSTMHEGIMNDLMDDGFFFDPVKKEIEESMMVEQISGLRNRVECYNIAQSLLEQLILDAGAMAKSFQNRAEVARVARKERERKEAEAAAKAKAAEEAEAAKRAAEEAAAAEAEEE
mmetsp:Transcript_14314/g.21431  ORF Transcript_14314/g.21431 Transcript_14314/m.21431 type:complete len:372 (-) Transcript_14314:208-1323(-)|eukprot:CAMPEP_0185018324 /NCGR_PEP_ID=MMETSP1103-20130426/1085_1 /TAXON_ID=36769 /ORGANISM="Paraphysomonas bandaiensis, Strain Caron Lab Isolate" /LENGTH=371 /DNA_ID=CAMNT_0027548099 /DNA_START=84 /DNA_END=1199 /DNA_ORIENTATION=+